MNCELISTKSFEANSYYLTIIINKTIRLQIDLTTLQPIFRKVFEKEGEREGEMTFLEKSSPPRILFI